MNLKSIYIIYMCVQRGEDREMNIVITSSIGHVARTVCYNNKLRTETFFSDPTRLLL